MRKHFSAPVLAALLVVGCALIRLLSGLHPDFLPGATPMVALAFVGAAYFTHRWSWLLGVAAIMLSELAFLSWNFKSNGQALSLMMLVSIGFYALVGGAGTLLARRAPLVALFGGPIVGSIIFYLLANTLSWQASAGSSFYAYPQSWAGWIQANTSGMPGYPPAWMFLRNAIVADAFFTAALIAILDPARLALSVRSKQAATQL